MEIKLPATWLVSKGIKISPDDDWYNGGYEKVSEEIANLLNSGSTISGFITSFANREDTGEKPVEDWVPVICIANCGTTYKCNTGMNWSLDGPSTTYNISYWKPDDKALMEMYTAEQNAKLTETKKETKLKLTKDDVGKEFLYFGEIAKVCNISDSAERFVLSTSTDGFIIVNKNGESCTSGSFQLEQYEPRYWLKDLPNADLFSESVSCITCNFNGWYVSQGSSLMTGKYVTNKMPELTPGDLGSSEISIDDLREWQRVNK